MPDAVDRVKVLRLDVESQTSIEAAAAEIKNAYGRVDCLLNVAGVLGDGGDTDLGPERSLNKIDRGWMERTMSINTIGPVMVAQSLVPLMKRDRRGEGRTVIASLSARVGSISDNELGGWYSYRISKAGLNMATRTMAHELKRYGILAVSLHPGTTDADLSRPFQKNVQESRLFPVDFTFRRFLNVVYSLDDTCTGGSTIGQVTLYRIEGVVRAVAESII